MIARMTWGDTSKQRLDRPADSQKKAITGENADGVFAAAGPGSRFRIQPTASSFVKRQELPFQSTR